MKFENTCDYFCKFGLLTFMSSDEEAIGTTDFEIWQRFSNIVPTNRQKDCWFVV